MRNIQIVRQGHVDFRPPQQTEEVELMSLHLPHRYGRMPILKAFAQSRQDERGKGDQAADRDRSPDLLSDIAGNAVQGASVVQQRFDGTEKTLATGRQR